MINSFTISRRKQAGITLVETAIALAIAAVVVSAAFAGFQANARRSEVRDNSQLISEMIADTKQLFGPSNRFSVLDTTKAMAARVIPTNMHSGSNAYNSYGGIVQIKGGTASGDVVGSSADANDQAKLVFSDVPRNQCVDLALSVERNLTGMLILPSGTTTGFERADSEAPGAAKTNGADPGNVVQKVSNDCIAAGTTDTGKYDFHMFFARN